MEFANVIDTTFKPLVYIFMLTVETYVIVKILSLLIGKIHAINQEKKRRFFMDRIVSDAFVLSADEFLRNPDAYENYVGVYVIYNRSQNLYYVGQATRTVDRLKSHLTGHGNGDVYADFKYGDEMFISIIPYELSFGSLNDMEADFIEYYDAVENGYNKTKGNHH